MTSPHASCGDALPMWKKLLRVAASLCLAAAVVPGIALADEIVLTNGIRLRGKVVKETAESVTIEASVGSRTAISRLGGHGRSRPGMVHYCLRKADLISYGIRGTDSASHCWEHERTERE